MSLYFIILLSSVFVPLVLSFDKKIQFYKRWVYVWVAIFVVAILYILPDVILTGIGVWGFNKNYHSDIVIGQVPLEEFLFFILVPYASVFIHYCLEYYFPKFKLKANLVRITVLVSALGLIIVMGLFYTKIYTVYASVLMMIALLFGAVWSIDSLSRFLCSFLIILIPFTVVDGILTGSFIQDEVVWYNPDHIIGLRVFTIPIEDYLYGFSLIYFVVFSIEMLENKIVYLIQNKG